MGALGLALISLDVLAYTGFIQERYSMNWLRKLLSGSRTPPTRKHVQPQNTSPPTIPTAKPTPKAPKMVPRDFIDLTEGEAFLICEIEVALYMGHDSRLTITELLALTVEDVGADTDGLILDYWRDHAVDADALAERLRPLSSKQTRCILSAAKKFWRLEASSEARGLIDVGLV